jgi:hypothetical protein
MFYNVLHVLEYETSLHGDSRLELQIDIIATKNILYVSILGTIS